ncbi:MAG: hypothetical protein AABZ30_04630 [Myxococcota bacterium]
MSRIRQHVNPLTARHLARRPPPLALPAGRPVEVELGCGDGQFLFERARAAPDGFYVGVEIRQEWVDRIARADVENVIAVNANLLVAPVMFPPESVTRFHVNFPDPLFKLRQRRRRWLTPEIASRLADALVPRGEIFFQSDVFETALDALDVLEGCARLHNAAGEWRFARANPYGARSRREVGCEEEGARIWRLRFAKVAA